MSGLTELLQRSEITFSRVIDLNEVRDLMRLLAEKMPAYIDYSYKMRGEIRLNEKPHELKLEESDSKFEGNLSSNSTGRITLFKLERVCSPEGSGYGSLRFHAIPGYGLGVHDPNETEIWDRARALIEEYFSQKAKAK